MSFISGWEGQQCKQDIDECTVDPDLCNYGSCNNTLGSYFCTCHLGYTGNLCQSEINECEPNPCQNGATCDDLINAFRCNCTEGSYTHYQSIQILEWYKVYCYRNWSFSQNNYYEFFALLYIFL